MLICTISLSAVQAKTNGGSKSTPQIDPVQTHNQRHKTPHADRKTAARHLRVKHQQEHRAELLNEAQHHQGYNGRGRAGLPKSGGRK